MSRRIEIYDTTLRDGSQGEGVNFSLQDKLLIARKLDDLGVDYIEGGYPYSNPKDADFFEEIRHLPLRHARICAFGMTRRKNCRPEDDPGLRALLASEAPIVTVVGKTWDLHVAQVLGVSLDENLRMIRETVSYLRSQGRQVFYDAEHFFDGLHAHQDYALQTLRAAEEAGAQRIILCDTNGGSLPDRITQAVRLAQQAVSTPLGIHCHNDSDVAVANSLAAVDAGVIQVQGTINGIGERCGNADLISILANLALKKGYQVLQPGSLRKLTEVSRYVYETANMNYRNNQPFVGVSAFAHKGGMHVHAVVRNTATYEHIDPALVGNERRILISELSGRSNIAAKTNRLKIPLDENLLRRVLERICDLENQGYEFEAAEASFDLLVRKMAGLYQPWFERLHYHVTVEADSAGRLESEATVKLRVRGQVEHVVAEGDGPVNALDAALRKALEPYYPALKQMRLLDYKVRVVNSRAGTAARVRVVIESGDGQDIWGTVGVSENIIEASWQALVDSFEYKLFKEANGLLGSP
ncbi:MAG: citramalate synthase [Gemmatales bacterium]|nr:citramalate synthase [Gemmatales bacterium]MDW8221721.1 citramalate synthase [Gemmatales bacterium]